MAQPTPTEQRAMFAQGFKKRMGNLAGVGERIATDVPKIASGLAKEEIFGLPGLVGDLIVPAMSAKGPLALDPAVQQATQQFQEEYGASGLAKKAGVELSDEFMDAEGNLRPEMLGRLLAPGALYAKTAGLAGLFKQAVTKTKTRGSGIENKGSGNAELDSSPSELGPMVKEAGSDEFVPLENTVGAPGASNESAGLNPVTKEGVPSGSVFAADQADYSPVRNALDNAESVMGLGKKGLTGEQYLARLKNQPSVTKAELDTSGLASFLTAKGNIRRKMDVDEVLDYFNTNNPEVKITKLRKGADDGLVPGDRLDGSLIAEGSQRFMANAETGANINREKDYGMLVVSNKNAPSAAKNHPLTHAQGVDGNFAHVRYSDHRDDLAGGDSRILEENQFDIFQQMGEGETLKVTNDRGEVINEYVTLTPRRKADYDARLEKLRDEPSFVAMRAAQQDAMDLGLKARQADIDAKSIDAEARSLSDLTVPLNQSADVFYQIGRDLRLNDANPVVIDSQLSVAAPDFLNSVVQDATIKFDLNEGQARLALDNALRSSPEELFQLNFDPTTGVPIKNIPVGNAAADMAKKIQDYAVAAVYNNTDAAPDQVQRLRDVFSKSISNRTVDFKGAIDNKNRFKEIDQSRITSREDYMKAQRQKEKAEAKVQNLKNKVFDDLPDDFVQYVYDAPDTGMVGIPVRDTDVQFVPAQPFKTSMQASRHNIMMAIQDAKKNNLKRIYFPDYRDIAEIRRDELTTDKPFSPEMFKLGYKDAPEKVIKELKQQYPELKTGTVSMDDLVANVNQVSDEIEGYPLTYIDLTSIPDETIIPRRYAAGGKVDLRSGIGNVFKLYS